MKITAKEILSNVSGGRVIRYELSAPEIALSARAGQFVSLMVTEEGERIPLTIVAANKNAGTITIIAQEAGLTTQLLARLEPGNSLYALVGPLGHPTEIKKYGNVILVGGGVGIAEIYPVAKAMREAGNHVTTIVGARSKELLILEKQMREASNDLHITTDDGSYGEKGFVTDVLKRLLSDGARNKTYGLVYAVGPIPMMRRVADTTRLFNIKTLVSLNALMVDATGMCGCCRVTVGGTVKFSCVDGPEFDAHTVDWDELIKRNRIYADKEKHICKLAQNGLL